jgi:TonB-dependent starch-binding outer membrane protein SusC
MLALLAPMELVAQERTITGRVTRAGTGEPVAAVEINAGPRFAATISDAEGRFAVTAPMGEARLTVYALGYRRMEVVVPAGQSTVQIALEADPFKLDELVVTGQATTIERRSATTAIGYVSADELNAVPAPTVLEALNGKLTGINLQSNSGAPGGGTQVQIRGNATILGSFTPLVVVDGVIYSNESIAGGRGFATDAAFRSLEADAPSRIADLNPADIASIEILKGAAASSIYGSKAANGVIVITTNRGRAGESQINVRQRVGVSTPLRLLESRRWTLDEAVEEYGDEAIPFFEDDPNPYFDHYEAVFDNRQLSTETLADISGGSETTRYFVSGANRRDEGIERNTAAIRQSLRTNLDHRLNTRVDLRISSAFTRSDQDRGWNNNCNNFACHGYAMTAIPSFVDLSRKNADGTFVTPTVGVNSNPLQLTELGINNEETHRFTGGVNLGLNAVTTGPQTLRFVAGGGVDAFDFKNEIWTPNELFTEIGSALPGEAIEVGARSLYWNWNLNALHDWQAEGWSASTSLGLQYEDRRVGNNSVRARNLLPGQRNIDQGTNVTVTEDQEQERTLALYAQEAIRLLDDQLLLQAGVRVERSSVNGDADRYFAFPKVSGSYRFIDLLGAGSELKLRAAYGETGNQPRFGEKFTTLGTPQLAGQQGLTVSTTSGFVDVEPERLKEVEAGVDGFLLDGRLNWEVTGFVRRTTNLLLERVPAPSSGFASQVFNGGEIRNQGLEVGLGFSPILGVDRQWILRGTFTRYTSEVVDLAGLPAFFPTGSGFGGLGQTFIEEGQPITQLVGFTYDENGVFDPELTRVGNTAPDFRVGLFSDLSVGIFDAALAVDWQQGGDVINLTQLLYDDFGTPADFGSDAWEVRTDALSDGVIVPYIEDGSFVKLREVTVGVRLPPSLLGPLGANQVRVALTGRNLLTITDYSGLDPEVSNFGAMAVRNNLDISPYPPSRSFFLDVSVGF